MAPSARSRPSSARAKASDWQASRQAITWAANASLISNSSQSWSASPAFSSAFDIANTGPSPMRRGDSPANAKARMWPSGGVPQAWAAASSPTSTATAPSVIIEEFPGVTVPLRRSK